MKDIILVDDHVIIRNGLKELIEKLGPYNISRQYDNGLDFVNSFPLDPVPDLVLMDVSMPEMDGDEVIAIMNKAGINVPVLILTLNNDENRLVRLFRLGVKGYLQKDCTATMMKDALHEILKNGYYHNEHMALALVTNENALQQSDPTYVVEKLSPREREFLQLACDENEYTYKQIANAMHVNPRTVDGYRESVFEKLGVKSKTGLVLFALRHNLLDKL